LRPKAQRIRSSRSSARSGLPHVEPLHIPVLSEIPVVGRILFDYDPLVYVAFILFGLWLIATRSTARAVDRTGATETAP